MNLPRVYAPPDPLEPRFLENRILDPNSNVRQFYDDDFRRHIEIDSLPSYAREGPAQDLMLAWSCWNTLVSHARKLQVLYSENRTAFSLLVNEMIMVRDEFQEAAALIIGSHTEVKIIAYWHRTTGDFDRAMWIYLKDFPESCSCARGYRKSARLAYETAHRLALNLSPISSTRLIIMYSYALFERALGLPHEAFGILWSAIYEATSHMAFYQAEPPDWQRDALMAILRMELESCEHEARTGSWNTRTYHPSLMPGFIPHCFVGRDSHFL